MYKMLLVNRFVKIALMRLADCEVQMHIAQDKCALPVSLLPPLVQIATNFKQPGSNIEWQDIGRTPCRPKEATFDRNNAAASQSSSRNGCTSSNKFG